MKRTYLMYPAPAPKKLTSALLWLLCIPLFFFIANHTKAQCLDAFKYTLGTTGADAAYDIVTAGNGEFFVVGTTLENGTGKNVLVTKMNVGGAVLWSKIYGGLGTEVVKKASKTRDNGLLITGSTGSFTNTKGDIMCLRLDSDGDLLWSRKFGLNSANGDVGMDITETSEGGYAVAGIINTASTNADMVIIRLDADANILWSKRFDKGQGENGIGIMESGNSLMVTAELQNSGADDEGLVVELNKSDGNLIRAVKLHPDTGGLNSPYISKDALNGGYWVSGNLTDKKQPSKMQQVMLKLDAGFNMVNSYKLVLPEYTNNSFAGFQSMSSGGFIACSGMESKSSGFIFNIRNDGSIGFAKKLVGGRDRKLNRLQLINNKIIAVGSDNRQGNDEMFIIAFDSGGATVPPCQTDTAELKVENHSFTTSAFIWSAITNIAFSNTTATFDINTTELFKTVLCSVDCAVQDTTSIEGCGNTWLNVNAAKSGITVGDLDITGNKITVEAIINRTQVYNAGFYGGDIVSKHCDPTDVNYLLRANRAEITTSNGFFSTPDICNIELNKTYHLAMVYDGSSLKYYRNGFLLSEVACNGNMILNNYPTTFGTTACPLNPHPSEFLGLMDEVRIWNVARTPDQLKAYMDKPLVNPSSQTGLQAYYTFDDLKNEQGNAAWDGQVLQNISIQQNNPTCDEFVADSCGILVTPSPVIVADFVAPDTVCINTPFTIRNTTAGGTNFYWNFNVADINSTPEGANLGNISGLFSLPVFTDQVYANGNYYVFVVNNYPGGLVRLDFGNSMLNTPVAVNLGNIGGIIPNNAEGIQVVQNNGKWYAIIVGGYPPGGVPSRIVKIEFGANIANNSPAGTNWGNLGNLNYPIDLHVFNENNNWYGFTVNFGNNSVTRFDFGNSFDNAPVGTNIGNVGKLNGPSGIYAINNNGNWHVFVTNDNSNSSISRIDFGNSLLNTPTGVNLGNIGNKLFKSRDIYIVKFCGGISGFVVNNQSGTDDIVRLDFNDDILSVPGAVSLGNIGGLNFPHSFSKLFRVGADLYSFITNVDNNSISRIKFSGSVNLNIDNSADSVPPSVTYSAPGIYNINLMVDEGLATQTSVCKTIVVKDCFQEHIVTPDFSIPDTVCINEPVKIKNNTTGATNFYWNFCQANINETPEGVNLGNIGNRFNVPVFMDYVFDNNNYYGFVVNYSGGKLTRLNFGNSLLNTPTSTDLGNFGGIIPSGIGGEGIQIVKNEDKWYAIIVGGYVPTGSTPRILKIDFGSNIANNTPVATNWGNLGNMSQPIDLHVFQEGNQWYGFTVNAENNSITRFSFSNSFENIPTAVNLGNLGNLSYPTGIYAINDNGFWRVFIVNAGNNSRTSGNFSLTRLDFGNSLLNTPVANNLGNPGNILKHPRDLTIMKFCDEIIGFAVNGLIGSDDIVKINFNNDLSSTPVITSLGNLGNLNFPHSISKIFRVDADLYSFITNAANNTITRIKFSGCTNSSTPNSSDSIPPSFTYNTPGVYNINLMVDEGLPTQTSLCKTIVVKDCFISTAVIPDFIIPDTVCVNTPVNIKNNTTGGTNFYWNFCVADINQTPEGTNLGNIDGQLKIPVFMDLAQDDNGDYYGFIINHIPGELIRYKFGNSYLNVPVVENLGNYSNAIPNQAEGLQVIKSNGQWYIVLVGGGNALTNSSPRIVVVNFGSSLGSTSQIANNWGNIGNLNQPIDLHVFNEAEHWYGFTVNALNNTITKFDFSNNLDNAPIATNLGGFGLLDYPDGIYAVNDNGFWRVFITNGAGKLTRLDFGASLLNTPIAVDLGNPGNLLVTPRDMLAVKFCGSYTGFIVNADTDEIIKLDFGTGFDQQPTAFSLGNIANFDRPHSLSKLFRENQDIYSFVTNADNNSLTRIKFSGCTNSNIPNSSDSAPPPVTYNTPGVYNINMMVDEGLPTQASVCKAVVVVAAPVKTPLFDTAFCAGDSLILKASFQGGTYTWNNGNTDSFITVIEPGTYWVQSDYYGCSIRDSINAIQNISPLVNLGPDTIICRTDSLLLNAGNPGAAYLWQDGSTTQTINAIDPGIYIVQVTNANGCATKDSLELTAYASMQLSVTNDTTICTGNTLVLSANANNAQTYIWSPSATLSGINIYNPVASPIDTTLYTVNVSDVNGCKASDSVWVNVAPLPTVSIFADTLICAGDSTQLSTNAVNALNYLWTPSAGLSNNNTAAPVATPASTTQYIVTVTTQYGCTANDTAVITVNPLPALAAATFDSLICIGNSTTIAATSPTAITYNWFPAAGLSDPSVAAPVATPLNTTSYYVQATDINGCSMLDSVLIGVKAKPVFSVDPSTTGICTGESVVLTASGGDTYAWSPAATLSDPNSAVTIATPVVTTTYKAVITDNICAITDSVFATVNITALSTIDVTKSNDVDCIIGNTTLSATGGVTYNWFPGKYLSDSTIANPVAAPLETTTYYAQVTNAGGCSGIDSVTVYVFKGSVENGYKLPSAFTPNNDGFNDCFGVRKWGTLASLDISIYNRWGNLVFHSNNASDCWDGNYKGQMQPPGAYVYQIRAQALCGTVYRKGTVVLIR